MASVDALKRIVESTERTHGQESDSSNNLLEVFCVDTSVSMARSQTFPYIFGESKLSLCRRIISQGFALPQNCALHTALVTFHATPKLAVPFSGHTTEQAELIKTALGIVEHQKGSAIFSSYAFCEKTISDYQHDHNLQGCKVLIHLFTDGIDNGSLPEDVTKYQNVVEPPNEGLRQSFLYSFDNNFEQSSALAKTLQAHLVVIHESELNIALEERDKWVLKFLAQKPKISKAHQGFNLAKGYTPDLASVYKVLQKAYRFFSSGNAASREGLFRVNANVTESRRLASQLLSGNEYLNDFEDSILVAHALKTALSSAPPILTPSLQHTLIDIARQKHLGVEAQLALCKTKIEELPPLNNECLHILLFLLQIIAQESNKNKMTSANLAVIFTYLLFPELLVPNPSLQDLVVHMIEQCNSIFAHPPTLKFTTSLAPSASETLRRSTDIIGPPSSSSTSTAAETLPRQLSSPRIGSLNTTTASTAPSTAEDSTPRVQHTASLILPEEHTQLTRSHSDNSLNGSATQTMTTIAATLPTSATNNTTSLNNTSLPTDTNTSFSRPIPPHLRRATLDSSNLGGIDKLAERFLPTLDQQTTCSPKEDRNDKPITNPEVSSVVGDEIKGAIGGDKATHSSSSSSGSSGSRGGTTASGEAPPHRYDSRSLPPNFSPPPAPGSK